MNTTTTIDFPYSDCYLPENIDSPTPPTTPIDYENMYDDDVEIFIERPLLVKKCLCTNVIGVKKVCIRQSCTFAHYLDEWAPEQCKFGSKCKNKHNTHEKGANNVCQRLHNNETKEQAIERMGVVFLSKKKYVNTRFHTMEYVINKKKTTTQ